MKNLLMGKEPVQSCNPHVVDPFDPVAHQLGGDRRLFRHGDVGSARGEDGDAAPRSRFPPSWKQNEGSRVLMVEGARNGSTDLPGGPRGETGDHDRRSVGPEAADDGENLFR
jgi:hypothetical protein